MANELISEYLDLPALQKQTDTFRAQIASLKKDYDELSRRETKLNISVNTKDVVNASNDASKALDKVAESTTRLDATTKKLAITRQQQIAIDKAERDEILAIQREVDKLTKLREKEAAAAKASAAIPFTTNLNPNGSVIQPTQGATSGAIGATATQNAQVAAITAAQQYAMAQKGVASAFSASTASGQKYVVTQKEIELALIQDKLLEQQRVAALKIQVREEIAAKGSIEQRRAALIRLASAYDKLSASERASPQGQRLQSVVSGLTSQVKTLEAETGRAQRNVGNYGSALAGAGKQLFGFVRTAAAIIPGLGIQGIVMLAVDGITALAEAALQGTEKLNRLRDAHRSYTETLIAGNENSAKEIVNLRILEKVATDENKPRAVRLQAVKDLKEQYPKYLGNLSDEAILSGKAAAAINLVADALYKKAFAEAASSKAAEVAGKQLQLELRRNFLLDRQKIVTKELSAAEKERLATLAKLSSQAEKNALVSSATGKAQLELTRLNNLLNENTEQYEFNGKQIKFFTEKAAENFESVSKLDPGKATAKIKTIRDVIAELNNELKAIQLEQDEGILTLKDADIKRVEKYKSTIEEIFKLKDTDAHKQDAALGLSVRLNPIAQRVLERQIHELFADQNAKIKKTPLAFPVKLEQTDNFEEEVQKRLNAVDYEVKERIKKAEEGFSAGTLNEEEYQHNITLAVKEGTEKRLQINQSVYTQTLEGQQRFLAIENNQAQLSLLQRYATGKLSRKQYEEELLTIQETYAQKALQNQIDSYKHELEFAFIGVEQTQEMADKKAEILKKIAELELQLQKSIVDGEDKSIERRKAKLLEFLGAAKDITSNLTAAFSELYGIGYDKEKAKNEEAIADIEKKNKAEVDAINVSARTEEQKAAAVALANDKAQKQKEAIDRKNAQAEERKARFEKAINIANIITSTALAVVNFLKQGPPFGIPLAIAAGALGLAQLSRAIAAPVPHYKHGKFDGYEGPAVVGDGGKAELRERKDGSFEVTPSTPTLTYVAKDDIIHPDAAAFMRNRAMKRMAGFAGMVAIKDNSAFDTRQLEKKMDNVVSAVNNKTAVHINITESGMQNLANSGQNWTEYINRNIRGKC